jgi:hypothetical protein
MDCPTKVMLNDVFGFAPFDVYAAGDNGVILHYNGRSWSMFPTVTDVNLRSIWGANPYEIFAAGDSGTILKYSCTKPNVPADSFQMIFLIIFLMSFLFPVDQ